MPIEWMADQLFEGLGIEEARWLSSGVVVLLAVILYLFAPFVVRRLVKLQRYRIVNRYVGDELRYLERTIHWPFPTKAVVRTLQFIVAFLAFVMLLFVWGYEGEAALVLDTAISFLPIVFRALLSILLVILGYIGTQFLRDILQEYTDDADHVTEHQEKVAYRVLQISVFLAVGIGVISLWGVDLTGLLVGAGFLGIVIGMAARQTLGSLIAGLVLMFSRPFEIGHWVEIGDHEGIVTDISMVNTRLRSFNDEAIVIPNDAVANRTVVNNSESERLRLHLDVGIEYGADIEHAQDVAAEAIKDLDPILRNPPPSVVPTTFGDSSIGLRLRYWIEYPSKPKEWNAHAAVVQAVKDAFDEEGITIPFPQRTLSGSVDANATVDDS